MLALSIIGATPARTQVVTPAPAELIRSAEIYTAEVARISSQHCEAVQGLPRQYQADLADMQKKLQASGDLDGMLAMAKESKRFAAALAGERDPFEVVPEMPENALVTEPAVLRTMQDAYLKRHTDSAETRNGKINELTTRYIKGLTAIQKELTRKDRIADAVVVRQEVERLRKAVTNENFIAQTLAILPEPKAGVTPPEGVLPAKTDPTNNTTAVFGSVPNWARWEWKKTDNYTQAGFLFAHPDLPDELDVDFNHKTGRGRVSGRCYFDRMVVDMRERIWFGKAILWQINDTQYLNATIQLQAKDISAGQNYGPAAQLVLFSDKTPLQSLTIPLMTTETTLRVVKDPEGNRCALMWLQGKRTEKVNLPDTGVLQLLLAITVRNPGERCDTTIVLQ
jgi:hypothetical protein